MVTGYSVKSLLTPSIDVVMESQARMLKRNLRRRGLEQSDSKSNKRKQTSDILFLKLYILAEGLIIVVDVNLILNLRFFSLCTFTPITGFQAQGGGDKRRSGSHAHCKGERIGCNCSL